MQNEVIEVAIKGVMPTANGCAVFLGNEDKTFVIYVDHSVGNAISMTLNGVKKERPLTHDLIGSILLGLGIALERIVINDVSEGTFFARIILHMQNELGQQDHRGRRPPERLHRARPPAKKADFRRAQGLRPVEDMTEILERVLKQQSEEGEQEEDEEGRARKRTRSGDEEEGEAVLNREPCGRQVSPDRLTPIHPPTRRRRRASRGACPRRSRRVCR